MIVKVKNLYKQLMGDSLFRNSIYLMMSTAVMAGLGFFFWIINARLFSVEQVGLGTTMISLLTLISSFSLLGLNNGIIRYLPRSKRKTEKINTSFTLVGILAFLISVTFLVGLHMFSPKLLFIRKNVFFATLFIFFSVINSLNFLIESVFVAYRSTIYVLIKNFIFSIFKLVLPFLMVPFGAFGILTSFATSTFFALFVAFAFLDYKFKYKFSPALHRGVINSMLKFSTENYIAGLFGSLPLLLLPIIITNKLGPQQSAFFYIDLMIANLIYVIPMAISQSLFAEGSYSENELYLQMKKAAKIISAMLLVAIILIISWGEYILLAFGEQYSSEGFKLLQIFAISGIFLSINYIGNVIFNIQHKTNLTILVNFMGASIILSLSIILIRLSLLGIGIAWIIGQGIISVLYIMFYFKVKIIRYRTS